MRAGQNGEISCFALLLYTKTRLETALQFLIIYYERKEELMEHLIKVTDLCKVYNPGENEVRALDHINLEVDTGELVAIISQSGAVRNKEIGFIFQGFNLISNLTAEENVELPLIYRGIDKKTRRQLSREALEMVGLAHRMNHKPSEMSGGQQQRVAIARAIAAKPPVILADEPTGNLDSASSKEILGILKDLHKGGRTVILITHDDGIAARAKRVVRIMDGKIESDIINPAFDSMEEEHEKGNNEE